MEFPTRERGIVTVRLDHDVGTLHFAECKESGKKANSGAIQVIYFS
jgi:hypothetical protein